MQPQPSPRTVVLTQPQIMAGATGPAQSVRPKQITRPGGSAKTDSYIVVGLMSRYKDGRQLHDDKILYINRKLLIKDKLFG